MANQINNDAQLQRMKALMNYGINESKQPVYSTVEYNKVAADGKLYGIVREGANYFIKVAKDVKGALVAENFDYINGFRNRKDNMFESFAAASRYFDEKMININESLDRIQRNVIEENYITEKKEVIAEQTDKMQQEIARQRQIMENAQRIMEGNNIGAARKPVVGKGVNDNSKSPKCTAEDGDCVKDIHGKAIKADAGNCFCIDATKAQKEAEKGTLKTESVHPALSSRENPDFMDTSHGTKIGNNAPFSETKEKVENAVADAEGGEAETSETPKDVNEAVMHTAQNQNTPSVGVGEPGDADPFDEKANVNESLDDMDDELEDGEDFDLGSEDDEFGAEAEDEMPAEEDEFADIEAAEEPVEDDINARMDAFEAKLDSILDAINNMKYDEDEELYPEDGEGSEDDFELEMGDEEEPMEGEDEDVTVKESKSYRAMKARMLKEEEDFGKHPAFQKTVMSLPANTNPKRNGQFDINDASVEGEQPYATQKGDNAPFEQSVEKVENAVVENVIRTLKKKLG